MDDLAGKGYYSGALNHIDVERYIEKFGQCKTVVNPGLQTAERKTGEIEKLLNEIEHQIVYVHERLERFSDLVQPALRPADKLNGNIGAATPNITLMGSRLHDILTRLYNISETLNNNIERCEL